MSEELTHKDSGKLIEILISDMPLTWAPRQRLGSTGCLWSLLKIQKTSSQTVSKIVLGLDLGTGTASASASASVSLPVWAGAVPI